MAEPMTFEAALEHKILPEEELRTLVERAKAGDVAARNRVLEHHLKLIWSIAGGLRSGDDRMELFEEGAVAALAALPSCNGGSVSGFISKVAKRAMLDFAYPLRRVRFDEANDPKPRPVSLEAMEEAGLELPDADGVPVDERIEAALLYDGVCDFLTDCFTGASLSFNEQNAIIWRTGFNGEGDVSFAEVARRLGCGRTTAKDTFDRAVFKLRRAGGFPDGATFAEIRKSIEATNSTEEGAS